MEFILTVDAHKQTSLKKQMASSRVKCFFRNKFSSGFQNIGHLNIVNVKLFRYLIHSRTHEMIKFIYNKRNVEYLSLNLVLFKVSNLHVCLHYLKSISG